MFKKIDIIFLVIILFAAIVRFYNFPNRITFWSEQARSLIVSANYINEKPSLLGQEYFRQDSNAHTIYSGAVFNYLLVPLILVSIYDPIIITSFFTILNIFTGVVIYFVVKKMFGVLPAIFSAFAFLFNDLMVYHSLFIWNYNILPLIGILSVYLIWLNLKEKNMKNLLLLGILAGIGISLQVLFVPIAVIVLIAGIWKVKKKVTGILTFFAGVVVGNLPMVLFDLRHDFYHMRSLFQYFIDTIGGKSDAGFAYYYLLPFWPVLAILVGLVIYKIWKKSKPFALSIIILYLIVNFASPKINWNKPTGMPTNLVVKDINIASSVIAKDAGGDFNVAEVLDFDKRAYVLRYFVQYRYGKIPQNITKYDNLDALYVLSQKDYNFENSDVWEIKVGGKYNVSLLSGVGRGYAIYKLTK